MSKLSKALRKAAAIPAAVLGGRGGAQDFADIGGFAPLSVPPGITLTGVQVTLARLLQLLGIKGSFGSFLLSSAIVPTVDVTSIVRAEFFGRALERSFTGNFITAAVAPHAGTVRINSGEIPQDGWLEHCMLSARRATASGAPGAVEITARIARRTDPPPSNETTLARAFFTGTGAVADGAQSYLPHPVRLYAGDTFIVRSSDASVGGSVDYDLNAVIHFDGG